MTSQLVEDVGLLEDKVRLDRCKAFMEGLSGRDISAVVPEIVELLHDRWSEIRFACAKQLARVPGIYSEALCTQLIQLCSGSVAWQTVHGSIIGLAAILQSAVDEEGTSPALDTVTSLCLKMIGHTSIPVKEASKNCLISIQQKVVAKAGMTQKVVHMIEEIVTQPGNYTEANTLTLDGLLSFLAASYQLYPELVPSEEPTASDMGVVGTLRLCALHPASSVRQKAGQILTLFVLTFVKPFAHGDDARSPVPVVSVILNLLTAALRTPHGEHWCLQEISLMVAEELVCAVIEHKLDILTEQCGLHGSDCTTSTPSWAMAQTLAFLTFLKDHLHILLAHEQFEVRRMAVQLTPQLARAYVLLNVTAGAQDQGGATPADEPADLSLHLSGDELDPFPQARCAVDEDNPACVSVRNSIVEDEREEGRPSLHSQASSEPAARERTTSAGGAEGGPGTTHHDFGLRVVLNSSFRGSITSAMPAARLDLPLVTEMVWLCECVKENQHFFEAFALSEQWKSNSVTKDLQMRVISTKDAAVLTHNYWNEEEPESGCSPAKSQPSRKVVDHWSLEVRGRLQEIEKRTHFHRTVKGLVASAVEIRSPCVVALLVRNCQALLALTERVITQWERLFSSAADVAAFTATLSTFNSVLDVGPIVISVDFLECVALVDSFLLSVQHRFTQCPDVADSSCVLLEETDFLMSSAEAQRRSLSALWDAWTKLLAQVQCVSRCSTHVSSRSGITGNCSSRPSASELLLLLETGSSGTSQRSPRADLFTASLGADPSSAHQENAGCTLGAAFLRLHKHLQGQMRQAEGKHTTSTTSSSNTAALTYPIEHLLADMDAEHVLLAPSLTNASIDVAGQGYGPAVGFSAPAASEYAYLQTPAHIVTHSVSGTPQSSHVAPTKTVYTPSAFNFSSPTGPSSHSHGHGKAASGAAVVHRYQAMDQWLCEAVSPVLTCLVGGCSDPVRAIKLAAIVAEWTAACLMHPLWLDGRHNARKNLFEALVLLLATAEGDKNQQSRPEDTVHCLLLLRIVRAIAEVLLLRATKPLLDIKSALCLIKAALSSARLHGRYWQALRDHCAGPTARLTAEDDDNGAAVAAVEDLYRLEVQPLVRECVTKVCEGAAYYQRVYPVTSPQSHAELLRLQLAAQQSPRREPGSPSRRSRSADSAGGSGDVSDILAAGAPATAVEDDEFSDWDEDSGTDEEQAHLTDTDAAAVARSLAQVLHQDSTELCDLLTEWLN